MATQIQDARGAPLFAWDQTRRHCTVGGCRAWVLWPNDEPTDPVCEHCWDAMAEAPPHDGRSVLNPAAMLQVVREAQRIKATVPWHGGRTERFRELADRFEITPRTVYRRLARGEPQWVQAFGRQALFVQAGQRIIRISAWEVAP